MADTFNVLYEALTLDQIVTLGNSHFLDVLDTPLLTRLEELMQDAHKSGRSREEAGAEVRMRLITEFPEVDQDTLHPLVKLAAYVMWNEK